MLWYVYYKIGPQQETALQDAFARLQTRMQAYGVHGMLSIRLNPQLQPEQPPTWMETWQLQAGGVAAAQVSALLQQAAQAAGFDAGIRKLEVFAPLLASQRIAGDEVCV